MVIEHVVRAREIVQNSSDFLQNRILKRHVHEELKSVLKPSLSLTLLRAHEKKSAIYYHEKKQNVIQELKKHQRALLREEYSTKSQNPFSKILHFVPQDQARVQQYLKARQSLRAAYIHEQECHQALLRVEAALICPHNLPDSIVNGLKVDPRTSSFTCSTCSLHLTKKIQNEKVGTFVTSVLFGSPLMYAILPLKVLLHHELERRSMRTEEFHAQVHQHELQAFESSARLIQRVVISCQLNHEREQRALRFARSVESRKQVLAAQEVAWNWTCARAGLVIVIQLTRQFQKWQVQKLVEADVARKSQASLERQVKAEERLADVAYQEVLRQEYADVYQKEMTMKHQLSQERHKQIETMREKQAQVFRCYRPLCGGRTFGNEKLFRIHLERHAEADERKEIEKRFVQRLRDAGFISPKPIHGAGMPGQPLQPIIVQRSKSRSSKSRKSPKSTWKQLQQSNQWSPCLVLVSENVHAPAVIPLSNRELNHDLSYVLGRSRKCDFQMNAPQWPGLVSKQHACIHVNVQEKQCHIEDLSSKNGLFVNDIRMNKLKCSLTLHHGDTIEIGRVGASRKPSKDGDHRVTYLYKDNDPAPVISAATAASFAVC